jgi:hypothetical protein
VAIDWRVRLWRIRSLVVFRKYVFITSNARRYSCYNTHYNESNRHNSIAAGDAVVESPSTLTCESVTLPTGNNTRPLSALNNLILVLQVTRMLLLTEVVKANPTPLSVSLCSCSCCVCVTSPLREVVSSRRTQSTRNNLIRQSYVF